MKASAAQLIEGAWYALCYDDQSPSGAPLAQYIGEGEFADEDGAYYHATQFDYFVRQV